MSPELKAFLAAEDLDDLGDAHKQIKALTEEDKAAVRAALKRWQDPQAVSNLLFYPDLIPRDVRLASLLRGLGEQHVPYYTLAAVCGLGEIDADTWSAEDRKRALAELLTLLRNTNDIRAERTSLALQHFAGEREVPQIIALLEHPNDTVRHNVRAWLFRKLRNRGVEALATALRDSGLRPEARRDVLADFKEYVMAPDAAGQPRVLFAYIPNLREVKPSTWKRLEPAVALPSKAGPAPDDGKGAEPEDLMEQLKDSAASVRRRAAVVLGKERREAAVPALARALQDRDERVRGAAREAVVRIGPKSFGALVDVLRCPDEASRIAAMSALHCLAPAARKTLTEEELTTLAAALKDESITVRLDAAQVLGKLRAGARSALPALFEAAGDTSYTAANVVVAESAITAALEIDPECRPELVKGALPHLITALKGKEAFAAAFAIASLGPDAREAVPALAEALPDERRYSDNVVVALREIGGDGIRPLADLVKGPRVPLEKRKDILWKLGCAEKADKQLIELLADVLKDREPCLRAAAAQALSRIGLRARAAVPALLGVLGDAELDKALEYEKDLLSRTLARMKGAAVPGLLGVVEDDAQPVLARFQALRALGMMGRKACAAQPVLAVVMRHRDQALAVTAAGAYAQVGGDAAKAIPVLKDGLRDKAPSVLRAALFEVERLGRRAGALVPELVPLLKHREREVRLLAARAVSTMGTSARPAVPALAELLKAGDGRDDNEEIAEDLKRLGPDAAEALPALIEQLPHLAAVSPHPVLDTLANIGPWATPALPALLKLLKDRKSWYHHEDVIKVLGEMGPAAVPALLAQVGEESEYVRAHAARALGRIGPGARGAVPALKKRLNNEWNVVRVWAAFALIRITGDSKGGMPVLLDLWDEGCGQWRLEIADALVLLGAEARPARDLLLRALLDEEAPWGVHQRVAHALGQFHDDADVIVPKLLALMEQPTNRNTRHRNCQHALEALGLLGPKAKAALPRLRALAEDDDNVLAEAAARAVEAVEAN
jgi:HEAT repeat protein